MSHDEINQSIMIIPKSDMTFSTVSSIWILYKNTLFALCIHQFNIHQKSILQDDNFISMLNKICVILCLLWSLLSPPATQQHFCNLVLEMFNDQGDCILIMNSRWKAWMTYSLVTEWTLQYSLLIYFKISVRLRFHVDLMLDECTLCIALQLFNARQSIKFGDLFKDAQCWAALFHIEISSYS